MKYAILIYILLLCFLPSAFAAEIKVDSQDAYKKALKNVEPGDVIVLANGEWRDFEILFRGEGTREQTITLTAETKGKVILTGQSNLRIAGKHLVVSGLVFRDGYSPTNTVIAFRRNKKELANHCRITEVVIDRFNHPQRFETSFWVMMYGKNNRFDHNHLVGKSNQGVTMAVRLDSSDSQENHHRIDHNYFGPRPVLGSNGGETLRIGTSKYSLTDSFTTVENNVFDRCNGEVEIISSKSGGNRFIGNLFLESRGTLTLRHGNNNLIENNVFLGNGVDHTGGIRVINKGQVVRNNYMYGLTGHRFGGALVVMNGVPDSPINRYHQVENAIIENNSIIDCDHIELAAGSDAERSAPPISSVFRNNLIYNQNGQNNIASYDDLSGVTFTDNYNHLVDKLPLDQGFISREISFVERPTGLLRPKDKKLDSIGASSDLSILDKHNTGVSWYTKPGPDTPFDTGANTTIQPDDRALSAAVAAARTGDVIVMAPGDYLVTGTIRIDKSLTIRSAQSPVEIQFDRNALFEIADGGALKLIGLEISGKSAPDMAGNSLIRTSRTSMLSNYKLIVENCVIEDLNTNHSFHFFTAAKHTFADQITIKNTAFRNITGHVLVMNKEPEDLGIYNGEYIQIHHSSFENIQGTVADIYRGGTDESTFGPHFVLEKSKVRNVGLGKRNKSGASLRLLGVQATDINHNLFQNSAPVHVTQTVGEPVTVLMENRFEGTPQPLIDDIARPKRSASKTETIIKKTSPGFRESLEKTIARIDAYFLTAPDVPAPKDPGGGYTHEQHKRNGVAIYDAGILHRLTGKKAYANHAKSLLLAYADLYPGLGEHPARKQQSPGRLFWQSLNEAVWLVYAIQGYEAILETLQPSEKKRIEERLLRPMADFLSHGQPQTFDKIHNHGTWATAAVGMTGYVIGDQQYVKKALYGLEGDGEAGFIKQLDMLFSPDGYYTEGPYYQRYALMPFVLFARAIQDHDPDLKIFEYRGNIILKAIYACVDLSYAGLFFPINDAIKDKGLDTVELRFGLAIAYAITKDPGLLSIAQSQKSYVLTDDGLEMARDIDAGLSKPFDFKSSLFRDGSKGTEGALAVLRSGVTPNHQALVFKATSQGMGHGHFDKLNWILYDNGHEIITDYGAARFLNVEQKNGGRYLPENKSWAKQTIAHNTLVVDESSHFNGKKDRGEQHHPKMIFFEDRDQIRIVSAIMKNAYDNVGFSRTMAQIEGVVPNHPIIIDVLNAGGQKVHRYDLPMHFSGQLIDVGPAFKSKQKLQALGEKNGYQHLWLRASAAVSAGSSFFMTWLKDNRFYTFTSLADQNMTVLFTELGANDPHFNLRKQQAIILRAEKVKAHSFVSLLEPHGEYNGPEEFTVASQSRIRQFQRFHQDGSDVIHIGALKGESVYLALSYDPRPEVTHHVKASGHSFTWKGFYSLFDSQGEAL